MKTPTTRLPDALAHSAAVWSAAAGERVELPWGFALRTPSAPSYPDLNMVIVERACEELTTEALAATVARLDLRQADAFDPAAADLLLAGLEARGWGVQLFSIMGFEGPPPDADPDIEEVRPVDLAELRREWLASIPELFGEDSLIEQGLAADRLIAASTPTRAFAARRDGRLVSMARVIGDRDVALVDDVYTSPEHRGDGLASAVVRTAVRASIDVGTGLLYLATDASGPARELYARLGFVPLGTETRFLRPTL